MAKRKTATSSKSRKPKKKSAKKKATLKAQLIKTAVGVSVLLLLVVAAGWLADHMLKRPTVKEQTPPKEAPQPRSYAIPTYEVYPKKDLPPPKALPKPPVAAPKKLPKVAIIIDDIGYDRKMADKFLRLNAVLTFSILPHSPSQKRIARAAHAKGFETMLHLPMEPIEYPAVNPGEGALLTTMTPDQLIRQLEKDLDAVPFIKGVNNHMGSKMTTVSTQMYQIFSILKKRKLFFIDSRTTADTLCKPSARLLRIPFAQRDVFLDHSQDPAAIRKQINRLITIALKTGEAIGIGHPHAVTYEVLREMLPDLKRRVELVPASKVVRDLG